MTPPIAPSSKIRPGSIEIRKSGASYWVGTGNLLQCAKSAADSLSSRRKKNGILKKKKPGGPSQQLNLYNKAS